MRVPDNSSSLVAWDWKSLPIIRRRARIDRWAPYLTVDSLLLMRFPAMFRAIWQSNSLVLLVSLKFYCRVLIPFNKCSLLV